MLVGEKFFRRALGNGSAGACEVKSWTQFCPRFDSVWGAACAGETGYFAVFVGLIFWCVSGCVFLSGAVARGMLMPVVVY